MALERADLVQEIVDYLRDSVSVNLTGLPLSGRGEVARQVAEDLRELGYAVVEVAGIGALRERPLAALALAGLPIPAGGAVASISATVAGLSKLLPPGRSTLIIEDADELDQDSRGALLAAHSSRAFPVLMVTRLARRLQPPAHALSAQFQPGVRIEVPPLDYDQLNRVVHRMLSGPVDSAAVGLIATLSGGVAGLAAAIVHIGRRNGVIVREGGLWRVAGDLRDLRLEEAVEPLLRDVGDDEMDVLSTLAVSGPIAIETAQQTMPGRTLAALGDLGLLQTISSGGAQFIGVFPRLLAEHLRSVGIAALAWGEGPIGGDRSAASSIGQLGMTNARAAFFNVRVAEHWQAQVNVLRAEWRADPTPQRALPLLAALNAASAPPGQFVEVLDGTAPDDGDSVAAARFAGWQAAYRALLRDDVDGACAVLRERCRSLPRQRGLLRAMEALLRLTVGTIPDAPLLEPIGVGRGAAEADEPGAQSLAIARLLAQLAAGRTEAALAALPDVAPTYPFYVEEYRVGAGLARVLHGDLDDGVEWALQAMAEAEARLDLGEVQAHAYVAALGLTFAGRLDDLEALLGPVLALRGATMLWEHYQIGLLGLASLAAGWRGQPEYAWALAVQAEAIGRRPGLFPGMTHGITPIRGLPRDGLEAAGGRLWRAVEDYLSRGCIAAGVALGITAVEAQPDPRRAAVVAEHARRTQSPLLRAFGEYIAATGTGDPDELKRCIDDLWERGARLHAVKAAVSRSLALRAAERTADAVAQADEAWERAAGLGSAVPGLFARLGRAVGLSVREREIALMVVDGMSVQGIAADLSLSNRTVENHLFAAYRKLGSGGRDDMVRAISTWAALA